MKTIFSTAEIHQRDRFDAWHEAVRRHVLDHHSEPGSRLNFEATLSASSLNELTLLKLTCSPMAVVHDARHFANSTDELIVCRQLEGSILIEQDGKVLTLEPRHWTVLDPRLPYRSDYGPGASVLAVKVPRRPLEARVGRVRGMLALSMQPAAGENGLVSDLLGLLPQHANKLGPSTGSVVEHTLDLLAIALAHQVGAGRPGVSSGRLVVLAQLRAAIEARLSDPALDAATAAAAAGVSIRYANAVLADEDTSLGKLIQTRRLERCRQALGNPAQAHRSISDIAYCWGFSDMTHFGRRFRAAFGVLPSEFRRTTALP